MGAFEWPGFVISLILFFLIGFMGGRQVLPYTQTTYYSGLLLRLLGVLVYHFIVFKFYKGTADPVIYYRWGIRYADYFSKLDLSPFFDADLWRGQRFVGTNFMGYPAALMIMLVGESFRGTWLVFSLLSFFGLIFMAKTFFRAYGFVDYKTYLGLVLLLPPLWFWTASISKDSWMIFGVGLFMLGFIQKNNKKQSITGMALGVFFCFLARPQIAAILAFSLAGSYFLISFKKMTLQNIVILFISVAGAFYFLSVIGISSEATEIENFALSQRQYSNYGGSSIQQVGGLAAYIYGPINILFRPFPWEVDGILQVITFLELYFIWFLLLRNIKSVKRAISVIRKDRLIAFCIVFIGLFSVGAGLALSNMGLIARQRIILYPFLLIIIYAYSDKRMRYLRKKRQERLKALRHA